MTDQDRQFVKAVEAMSPHEDYQRLCRIIRTYEKMLAEGVVVVGESYHGPWWESAAGKKDTHRARLVQIEAIPSQDQ